MCVQLEPDPATDAVPADFSELGLDSSTVIATFGGGCPTGCVADLDCNGAVDGADLGVMLGAWGTGGSADINCDGAVDGADLGVLLGLWGEC